MSNDPHAWEPAEAGDLKVGDYIRIDHRWFDHPFERRMFRISSEKEIATIRDTELTRVFVDRTPPPEETQQTPPAAEPLAAAPASAEAATPAEGAAPADDAAAAPAAPAAPPDPKIEAARQAAKLAEQREALAAARARDKVTRERALQTLGMLSAGQQDSAAAVAGFVDFLLAIVNNSTTPLAPMSPAAPRHSKVRLALLGSDAVWLAGVIGKRMGLSRDELRALTHAAVVHAVGLTRMPPNLPEEGQGGAGLRGTPLAKYPGYSALILQQCGGFPAAVVRIVAEHRERPDGTGLPKGLKGEQIHPHALIIGAVCELLARCADSSIAPAVALASHYKAMRETYGAVIVNHLVTAVLLIPVGTYVQLSDGSVACVVRLNEAARMFPVVESFGPNAELRAPQEIDLSQQRTLFIVRALDTSRLPPHMFDTVRNTSADARPPQPMPDLPPAPGDAASMDADAAVENEAAPLAAQASGA
jgi:hypothetical protein